MAALLDRISVKLAMQTLSLAQVASVSVRDATTLAVNVHEPHTLSAVEKAIRGAGLGLNPVSDGSTITVPLPKMTREGRDEIAKQASHIAELARNQLRRERQNAMKHLKKALMHGKGISSDEIMAMEKEVQKEMDKAIKKVDEMLKQKTAEINP